MKNFRVRSRSGEESMDEGGSKFRDEGGKRQPEYVDCRKCAPIVVGSTHVELGTTPDENMHGIQNRRAPCNSEDGGRVTRSAMKGPI